MYLPEAVCHIASFAIAHSNREATPKRRRTKKCSTAAAEQEERRQNSLRLQTFFEMPSSGELAVA